MINPLQNIIQTHKAGETAGIYSVCSANQYVLEASMQQANVDNSILLIESTSNQVDQYGGYTGMTPQMFVDYVKQTAVRMDFPFERIVLGGDHLGPNVWQNEAAKDAMMKAAGQIGSYVRAGFTKIHLDTSMRCADDPMEQGAPLDTEIIASRAAELCKMAERAAAELGSGDLPIYVIGTDVPIPGGAQESLKDIMPTPVDEVEQTIEITKRAFDSLGLQSAWERVVAVVVQPGVEFDDTNIIEYDREKAATLSEYIDKRDGLVYEAHSTDYQTRGSLRRMVEDHFAVLKVGPALTFAFREAVFALAQIEEELFAGRNDIRLSRLIETIDEAMLENPDYWQKHYRGNKHEAALARKYSFSDRIRYYWPDSRVTGALNQLVENLSRNPVPLSLLSYFMPIQYHKTREGVLNYDPLQLIRDKIMEVTDVYSAAAGLGDGANYG